MINKELLSEVLGLCCGVKSIRNSEVIYWFNCIGEVRESSINIYELAHKCKEWAIIRQFYNVASLSYYTGHTCIIRQDPMTFLNTELIFRAGTEPEAIFKACQYIMENKCGS